MFPPVSRGHELPATSTFSLSGRRCWKKTKQRDESVWSPLLESALVEALEKYRPTNCLNTLLLRRFPKRNRFISDYIFSVTGTRRTAKQVGSRLQQMRDTCADPKILNLLSRREYSPEAAEEPSTPSDSSLLLDFTFSSTAPSPTSTSDVSDISADNGSRSRRLPPRTFVTIELVPPPGSILLQHDQIHTYHKSPRTSQRRVSLEYPSEIETNYPTLTFSTRRKISTSQHYSHFRVLFGDVIAHSEITELTFASTSLTLSPTDTKRHTYNTILIPLYWAHLCRTAQLFQCVIEQDIMKTPTPFDTIPRASSPCDQSIRSVAYEFSVRATAPVFRPPSLPSEPSLPPGFPGVGSTSRVPTMQPVNKTSRGAHMSFFPPQVAEPPSFIPPKSIPDEEYLVYGLDGSYSAPPQDGLFSDTSFYPQPTPPPFGLPYVPYPAPYDNIYYSRVSLYGPSDSNQCLVAPYNSNNTNLFSSSAQWSDSPMYSELNSNYC
ncbi:hypothetical protein B0H19DRAFT_1251125 [Mycena capillaripes]|nr:hypothetical protein B0H19DRAFT_1251125 [Mycena capillaripes]